MGHVCVVEQVQQVAGAQEEAIILAQALLDRERLGAEESERLHKSKVSFFLPVSRFLQLTAKSARVAVCGRVPTFLCVCVCVEEAVGEMQLIDALAVREHTRNSCA